MTLEAGRNASEQTVHAELLWVGDGQWCACDSAVAADDPRRVIAFLDCKDQHVDVVWVREQRADERFDTLREALHAVRTSAAMVHANTATR